MVIAKNAVGNLGFCVQCYYLPFRSGLMLLSVLAVIEERLPDRSPDLPSNPPLSLSNNSLCLLRNWLSQTSGSASNIMWVTGVPNSFALSDLSAICYDRCLLAASFSFSSRKGSEQALQIVPTLAHQITVHLPSLSPFIGRAVALNPGIFSKSLSTQFETIIFGPFRECASIQGDSLLRSFVLIDGLELYHDLPTQKLITSAIEMVATTSSIPLRFLFTSRQSSKDYELPLLPGTHLRIYEGPNASLSKESRLSLRFNPSRQTKTLYHGFPQLVQVESSINDAESYTRSLMMLGHGVPLWRPTGDLASPVEYLHRGPEVGDIMFIDEYGVFLFLFNIFRARDDPINGEIVRLGGQYEPLTLDPSEVTRVNDYFPRGAVITSTGVIATKKCEQPL